MEELVRVSDKISRINPGFLDPTIAPICTVLSSATLSGNDVSGIFKKLNYQNI